MADLQMMMTPENLAAMDKVPVRNYLQALDWQNNAQTADADAMKRMQTLRDLSQQQQQANVAQTQAQTAEAQARLPGITAESKQKAYDTDWKTSIDPEVHIRGKIKEMMAKETDDDVKTILNQAKAKMMTATPGSPEHKQAQTIYENSAEEYSKRLAAKDEKDKQLLRAQAQMDVAREVTNRATSVANIRAASLDKATTTKLDNMPPANRLGMIRDMIAKEESSPQPDTNKLLELRARESQALQQVNAAMENAMKRGGMEQDAQGNWHMPTPSLVKPMAGPAGGIPQPVQPRPPMVPAAAEIPTGPMVPGFSRTAPERTAPQPSPQPNLPVGARPTAGWPAQPAPTGRLYIRDASGKVVGSIPAAQAEQAMQQGYEVQPR